VLVVAWVCGGGWSPEAVEFEAEWAVQAGCGDFEGAVVLAGFEGDHFAVGEAAVFGFEFSVQEAVGRAELLVATGFGDH
jgi:hypothetical protein